jgi:hypothetical protein
MAHRVQHEDRVVVNLVQQRPVLILADPQRLFRQAAPAAAADEAEPRATGDQQAQSGSQKEPDPGLQQPPFRIGGASVQQSRLFVLHGLHDLAKLLW